MSDPSLAYFRANEGRWRCVFAFAETDWDALRRSPLGVLDRLRVRLMVLVPKLLGPLVLETRVDATSRAAAREVVHTTRISKWGLPLYQAVEVFALDPGGAHIAITRRERMWPSPFYRREVGRSRGEVEPGGRVARYEFPFLGTTMRQTGTIEDGGVRIVQETEFSLAEQVLVRW
jgi:hypothetical protein